MYVAILVTLVERDQRKSSDTFLCDIKIEMLYKQDAEHDAVQLWIWIVVSK